MRSWILYIVLILFVLSNSTQNQFVKLPVFFHHYFEHSSENPNCSLSQFVREHYILLQHPDDRHGDHEKLPFKEVPVDTQSIFVNRIPIEVITSCHQVILEKVMSVEIQSLALKGSHKLVWRPPIFQA